MVGHIRCQTGCLVHDGQLQRVGILNTVFVVAAHGSVGLHCHIRLVAQECTVYSIIECSKVEVKGDVIVAQLVGDVHSGGAFTVSGSTGGLGVDLHLLRRIHTGCGLLFFRCVYQVFRSLCHKDRSVGHFRLVGSDFSHMTLDVGKVYGGLTTEPYNKVHTLVVSNLHGYAIPGAHFHTAPGCGAHISGNGFAGRLVDNHQAHIICHCCNTGIEHALGLKGLHMQVGFAAFHTRRHRSIVEVEGDVVVAVLIGEVNRCIAQVVGRNICNLVIGVHLLCRINTGCILLCIVGFYQIFRGYCNQNGFLRLLGFIGSDFPIMPLDIGQVYRSICVQPEQQVELCPISYLTGHGVPGLHLYIAPGQGAGVLVGHIRCQTGCLVHDGQFQRVGILNTV